MIESIDRIDNIGRFRKFVWSEGVPCFVKYNFVFGENGSGKTTLSNVLRLFAAESTPGLYDELASSSGCTVQATIKGNSVTFVEGSQTTQRIFVFNSDFVADHVYDGTTLTFKEFDGTIVTDKQLANPKIKELEAKLAELTGEKEKKQNHQTELQAGFDEIKRNLAADLNSRIQGTRTPSMSIPDWIPEGSAEEYSKNLTAAYREHNRALTQQALVEDQTKVKNLEFSKLATETSTITNILGKSVAAQARERIQNHIEAIGPQNLRHTTTVRNWLEDGLAMLKSLGQTNDAICPLCMSELHNCITDLLADYEAFFSQAFSVLIDEISDALKVIDRDLANITENKQSTQTLHDITMKHRNLIDSSQILLSSQYKSQSQRHQQGPDAQQILEKLRNLLKQKQDNIDEQSLQIPAAAENLIADYNQQIAIKRERCYVLAQRLAPGLRTPPEVLSDIRSLIVQAVYARFNEAGKGEQIKDYLAIRDRVSEIDKLMLKTKEARNAEISRMCSEAQYVNQYLRSLSINHFELVMETSASDGIYIRFRDGTIKHRLKHSLSESEKTALALAYFISKVRYEVVDASGVELDETIIVVDDPVSSLDDGRLHSTAQLLWNEFSESEQLFMMSHNLLFMRFLSNLVGNAKREDGNGKKISCRRDYYLGRYANTLVELPRELSNYRTLYFRRLADLAAYVEGTTQHETAKLFAPNYIRTTLEAFLSFKFHVLKDGSASQKYRSAGLEKLIGTLKAKRHVWADLPAVNEINVNSLIDKLNGIKRITDLQSHGSPIDVDHVSFVSEKELLDAVRDTLDAIRFLDRIHASEAFGELRK